MGARSNWGRNGQSFEKEHIQFTFYIIFFLSIVAMLALLSFQLSPVSALIVAINENIP